MSQSISGFVSFKCGNLVLKQITGDYVRRLRLPLAKLKEFNSILENYGLPKIEDWIYKKYDINPIVSLCSMAAIYSSSVLHEAKMAAQQGAYAISKNMLDNDNLGDDIIDFYCMLRNEGYIPGALFNGEEAFSRIKNSICLYDEVNNYLAV